MPTKLDTQAFLKQVVAAVDAGESVPSIARRLGMSRTTMAHRLARYRKNGPPLFNWEGRLKLPTDAPTLAYIAGIIDGEGCICWTRGGRKDPYWLVRVGMTDERLIRWFGSFGGAVYAYTKRQPHHKPSWHWTLARRRDIYTFLTAILPYLRVKRARAEECLASPHMQKIRDTLALLPS